MNINRRRFIKLGSLTTAGLSFISFKDIAGIRDNTGNVPFALDQELYQSFKDPANIYRPFVRWWLHWEPGI